MAENSNIEWTDHTLNPWIGCTKVSPACTNCYAERDMDKRLGKVAWGPNGTRVVTTDANWRKPVKWNLQHETELETWNQCGGTWEEPERPRVFCASLADVFEDWDGPMHDHQGYQLCFHPSEPDRFVPIIPDVQPLEPDWPPVTMDDVRARLFRLIDKTPHLDWLLLTKRPENIARMWPSIQGDTFRKQLDDQSINPRIHRKNVWLGTSVENQEQAEKRIPHLLGCRGLSPVLFLSMEPLLGPVDLSSLDAGPGRHPYTGVLESGQINWIIAGGESGPGARPSHPDWFRSIRDQCAAANVPFLMKQWGEWVDGDHDEVTFADEHTEKLPWVDTGDMTPVVRIGKKRAGRILDGRVHDGFPTVGGL